MNLRLDPSLVTNYKSHSQIARIMSEAWFEENGYCPACPNDHLYRLGNNTKVFDFQCSRCDELYQLKSKGGRFGGTVANSEYNQKIKRIKSGEAPNYAFMSYDSREFTITSLAILPRHFMTLGCIQPRKPLSENARRKGWVGSNILLKNLPSDAMLYMIKNHEIMDPILVRQAWNRFSFLGESNVYTRGWTIDVLNCVRNLDEKEFTLQDIYGYKEYLQSLHPNNHHVQDKIRQQLQILRDNGIITFEKRGRYRMI